MASPLAGRAHGHAATAQTSDHGPRGARRAAARDGVSRLVTLDFYTVSGITNSPLLKDYKNQAESNLVDSLRINAGYKPQISASSNNSYAPTFKGYGYESAITNGGNFSQLIGVTKRLVSKENLQNQYQAINLQNQLLQVSGKLTEQDIKRSISTQYITAYGIWQQYLFNNEVLDLLKKEESICA